MSMALDLLPTRRACLRYGLLASAWAAVPSLAVGQTLMFPGPGKGVSPFITGTLYLDMNIGAANGTVIDTTMLAAGAHNNGAVSFWFLACQGACGLTVQGPASPLPAPVKVGATVYPVQQPARIIQMDHSHAFDFLSFRYQAGIRVCSVGVFIRFGPSNAGAGSQLWDYLRMRTEVTSYFVVLQLNNGSGGAGYGINIETNPGGTTTHSTRIDLTPGARYWCSLRANFTSGVAEMAVYTDTTLTLVGQVSTPQGTGEDLAEFQFGQGEEGILPGVFSTYEHLVVDTATGQFPLGPRGLLV